MKAPTFVVGLYAACLSLTPAATIEFWVAGSTDTPVDGNLRGTVVPDHLSSSDYSTVLGEILLMPTDSSILSALGVATVGISQGDSGDIFSGTKGLVAFCIDSEISLQRSTSTAETFNFSNHSFAEANARYLSENVAYYIDGSLKKAAYLMETYLSSVTTEIEGAALQAAIWETLYDSDLDVSTGQGAYYLRNNTRNSINNTAASQAITIANAWLTAAEGNNFGGASYDPDGQVAFWLDPTDTQSSQSLMSLTPPGIINIPEPSALMLLFLAPLAAMRRTRRS